MSTVQTTRSGSPSAAVTQAGSNPTGSELGAAIRSLYQGRFTQAELAARLGVAQNTVSRWSTGAVEPSLDDIARIEYLCEVPRGSVLRSAGYVIDLRTVEEMIDADDNLTTEQRALLLTAYRTFQQIDR